MFPQPDDQTSSDLLSRIFSLQRSRKYEEALKEADDFIAKFPKSYLGYRAKAQVFRSLNVLDQAILAANEALKYSPRDNHAFFSSNFLVADIYLKAGLLEEAVPHLKIASNPKFLRSVHANWYLCEIYIRLGDRSNAKIYLDRLPSDFEEIYGLGRKETTRAFLEEQVAAMGRVIK